MRPELKQCWMMSGVILNLATCGFHVGYPTILLRDLKAPGSLIQLTLEAESWVVSSIAISSLPSALLIAPTLQALGRKTAHISLVLSSIIACLILYFAQDVTALVAARLVFGFSFGSTVFVAAIIIGEYTSPEYRGVYLNAKSASFTVGVFMVHGVGVFFDWKTTALIGLIPSTLSLLITLTWSESPAWLAYKGKYGACKVSFQSLRGDSDRAKEELLLLMQVQRRRRLCKIKDNSKFNRINRTLSRLARDDFQKPSLIVFFVYVILESCGRHSFSAYAIKFMSAFTTDNTTTLYYVVGVDAIVCIFSLCSCGLVKVFRRRSILFSFGGAACVLLLFICIYLCLKSQKIVPEDNMWLPLSLLFVYNVVVNIGVAPIVMTLLGEVYPLENKGLGTVTSALFFSLSLLIALKVTPALIRNIDVYGTYFVYFLCMAASLVYLYIFLPETEGKTLLEIENHFNGVSLTLQNSNDERLIDSK